jgi:hypothetical protein
VIPHDVILHGLHIHTDIPLHQGRAAPPGGGADLRVEAGIPMAPDHRRPEGTVLAYHALSEEEWSCFVRTHDGSYRLRYAGVCDFAVDADLRHVVVHPVTGTPADRVAVFAGGALPAFVLVMRGEVVLHASAVEIDGRALAFVGQSGMGKSTLATLLCDAGGLLVTDDVLRVDLGNGARCYLGNAELRLRHGIGDLVRDPALAGDVRPTGDGRQALRMPASTDELLPLAAIVVPMRDPDAARLDVRTMDRIEAVLAMLSLPRFPGWEDAPSQAGQLQRLSDLCDVVPVYTAHVPWGLPAPPGLLAELLDGVGIDHVFPDG